MLKKAFCLLIASFSIVSHSYACYCPLPEEFTVTQRWLSLTTTFDIATARDRIGTVHRAFFSLLPEYQFLDIDENLLAKARMRLFTFFAVFDVEDENANPLGTVEEEFSWVFPTFTLIAPEGEIWGDAVLNFWGTTYVISDPVYGLPFIIMSRPFFHVKSDWVVSIIDPYYVREKNIHPHLIMTLAAFQVDREYWRKQTRRDRYSIEVFLDKECSVLPLLEEKKVYFRETLEKYRATLSSMEPTDEDFAWIESYTDFSCSSDEVETIESQINKLFTLFSSDQLTDAQKVALFLMLEERFKEDQV